MATRTPAEGRAPGRPALWSRAAIAPLRRWSGRQWRVAAVGALVAFVLVGEIGETLPPASVGRMYPVLWWNWLALVASSALLGLAVVVLSITLLLRLRAATTCRVEVATPAR